MKIDLLKPQVESRTSFRRNSLHNIPDTPGCYVLSTFEGEILYIGLSKNIRRRIDEHMDSAEKVQLTKFGRATLVHWLRGDAVERIERSWMNHFSMIEGTLPPYNKVYSPVSV